MTVGTGPAAAVVFSPDGKMLAVASGATVELWNVTNPAEPSKIGLPITGPVNAVGAMRFSPNGRTLATGSFDGTIRLWNLDAPAYPRLIGQPLDEHDGFVNSLAYSPNGRILASGNGNGTFQLWDVASSGAVQPHGTPIIAANSYVYSLDFSRDGGTLATGSTDSSIRLWSLNVNTAISRICALSKNNLTQAQWAKYVQGESYKPPCGTRGLLTFAGSIDKRSG